MPLRPKERGKFLTFMLVLGLLGTVVSILQVISPGTLGTLESSYIGVTPGYRLWFTVYVFSHIPIFIGIWKWKRIAVYAFFLIGGVQTLLISTTLEPIYYPKTLLAVASAAVTGLWFWAIKRKWHLFS